MVGILVIEVFQCLLRESEGSVTPSNSPEKCNQLLLTKGLLWVALVPDGLPGRRRKNLVFLPHVTSSWKRLLPKLSSV